MSAVLDEALTVSDDAKNALHELSRMVRAWRAANSPHVPLSGDQYWRELVDAGWHRFGITVDGESSTAACDVLGLAELCGRELLALPLISTVLALRHIGQSDPARARAWDGSTPLALALPATRNRLLVPFAPGARAILPLPASPIVAGPEKFLGQPDAYAQTFPMVFLDDAAGHLGAGGFEHALASQAVRETALAYASSTVGCASRCLARSVEYAGQRSAYGALIGSFQALRHIMADMYRDIELARSGLVGALVEENWVPLALYCTTVTQRVVAQSIQVHGGIGFTWDAGLHFHARHILAVRKMLTQLDDARATGTRSINLSPSKTPS